MDYAAKALSRAYWQYRNSPKLLAWMKILPSIVQESIEKPLNQIISILDIDSAAGDQLDVIARIAGINSRPSIESEYVGFFGYAVTPAARGYGEAPYIGPGEVVATYPAPDSLFRVIIRAKIYKNISTATIDEVKEAVDFILDERCTVVDGQDMTIEAIWLTRPLPPATRKVIETQRLIPRPQGVRIRFMDRWPVPEDYQEYAPEYVGLMSEIDSAMNSAWPAS